MNRLLLVAGSAAVGAAGLIAVVPRAASPAVPTTLGATSPATPGSDGSSTGDGSSSSSADPSEPGTGSSSGSSPSATPSEPAPSSASQTVVSDEMWNGYGPIQVRVTVDNGQVTAVELTEEPGDGRSRFINSRAVPILVSQALKAQSAQIDGVSGATDTSHAFMQALANALQKVTS